MNDLPVLNFHDCVMLAGNKLVTDSRKVAKAFGKRHDNVLRSVQYVECSPEFNRLNFKEIEYLDTRGRIQKAVQMTERGFWFVALAFTGKKAALMREAFINAFMAMAEHLKMQAENLWQQRLTAEADYLNARHYASACGRVLRRWHDEKSERLRHIKTLEHQIQPSLLLH